MTLTELENRALKLSLPEKWHLVQSLLKSIEDESHLISPQSKKGTSVKKLHSWTQSLMGVIQEQDISSGESYISYLEEKYR